MYWGLKNLGSHLGSTSGAHVTVHKQSVTPVPVIPFSGFQGHSPHAQGAQTYMQAKLHTRKIQIQARKRILVLHLWPCCPAQLRKNVRRCLLQGLQESLLSLYHVGPRDSQDTRMEAVSSLTEHL